MNEADHTFILINSLISHLINLFNFPKHDKKCDFRIAV